MLADRNEGERRASPAPTVAPFQSHSMIYSCCMPAGVQRELRLTARASGATRIRVDFAVNGILSTAPGQAATFDWTATDQTLALARRTDLDVVGVLTGTPDFMAACEPGVPADQRPSCPPADPRRYIDALASVAEHARGQVAAWELFNEPEFDKNFRGTAAQYGRLLGGFHRAVGRVSPGVPVLNGGIASPGHRRWLNAAVTAGARFDIGSAHLRGPAARVGSTVDAFERVFAEATGQRLPLWITETGYPADAATQDDPAHRGGETGQASYLEAALPAMREAGADQVFVTLRDGPEFGPVSPYRYEGIAAFDGTRARARRALTAVAELNDAAAR